MYKTRSRRPVNRRNKNTRRGKTNKRKQYVKKQVRPAITDLQSGLPRQMFTKLKYYENNYTYSFGIGDKLVKVPIRMNDPRDPYALTGGKSALYYDFWIQAYRYLRVMAAEITITWVKATDTNQGVVFALVPNLFASNFQDMDDVTSQPYVKTSRFIANRVGDSCSLSYYLPIHQILNMTKLQYDTQLPGSAYDCSYNASPSAGAYLDVVIGRLNENDTSAITGAYMVSIKFYVKLYQRYQFVETGFDANDNALDDGEVAKNNSLSDWYLHGATGATGAFNE